MSSTLDNDLCLINFDEDIIAADSSNDTQMACLNDTIPETGTKCWVAGWGLTSTSGYISDSLKSVQVDLMNLDYCRRYSGYPFSWFGPEMICAGRLDYDEDGEADGGNGTCQGDSGGPLICDVDGQAALIGVVSKGSSAGCAVEGAPGGYSSPAYSKSYKWIRETVNPDLITTTAATSTSSFTETRLHFFVFIIALLVLG